MSNVVDDFQFSSIHISFLLRYSALEFLNTVFRSSMYCDDHRRYLGLVKQQEKGVLCGSASR